MKHKAILTVCTETGILVCEFEYADSKTAFSLIRHDFDPETGEVSRYAFLTEGPKTMPLGDSLGSNLFFLLKKVGLELPDGKVIRDENQFRENYLRLQINWLIPVTVEEIRNHPNFRKLEI